MRRSITLAHIEFLVAAKYPALRTRLRDAHWNGKPDELREMEQQAAAYRAELGELSPHALDQLYAQAQSGKPQHETASRRPPRSPAKSNPEQIAEADYAYWAKMPRWTVKEAAALSCGILPEAIPDRQFSAPRSSNPDNVAFKRLKELIKRAVETATIAKAGKGLCPESYITWALRHEVTLPAELVRHMGRRQAATQEHSTTTRPVATRERDTFLKIIGGMAMGGYGYDPKTARSSTVTEIHDDLARHGVTLDPDTIRHKLKEAALLLADDFMEVR